MPKSKSWLRSILERLAGEDEVPEPPDIFRALGRDFARHNPDATVADWTELFAHGCREAWRDGYRAGWSHQTMGSVELPGSLVDDQEEYEEQAGAVDLNSVVPLQQGPNMRNVVFTDEQGLAIDEENDR